MKEDMTGTSSVLLTGAGRFQTKPVRRKRCFMKNMIFTVLLLALSILFTGCDKANAENVKKAGTDHKKHPAPHEILIIDEVAYIDGCKGCECVEEDICVCEAKADCECCRKNLKKVPHEMQEKCKKLKHDHAKKMAECKDCKSGSNDTACNDPGNGKPSGSDQKSETTSAKKGK